MRSSPSTDAAGRRACTACHTNVGRNPAGGLNLLPEVAYGALVNVDSVTNRGSVRVVPGDPDSSILVKKLEGAPGMVGQRMPIGGPPYLTAGQILIIRRWIRAGCPEQLTRDASHETRETTVNRTSLLRS